MSLKIAIGSSDGKVIDQHFGSSKEFYVFNLLDDGSYEYVETRQIKDIHKENRGCNTEVGASGHTGCGSGCNSGGHDPSRIFNIINALLDCHTVIVKQIGRNSEKALNSKGIQVLEASGTIDNAFSKLFVYYKRIREI